MFATIIEYLIKTWNFIVHEGGWVVLVLIAIFIVLPILDGGMSINAVEGRWNF